MIFNRKVRALDEIRAERVTLTATLEAAQTKLAALSSDREQILASGTPAEMLANANAQAEQKAIVEISESRLRANAQAEQARAEHDDQAARQLKFDAGIKAQATGRDALRTYTRKAEEIATALLQLAAAERVIAEANAFLPSGKTALEPAEQPRNATEPVFESNGFPRAVGTAHVCLVDRVVLPKVSASRADYHFGATNVPSLGYQR